MDGLPGVVQVFIVIAVLLVLIGIIAFILKVLSVPVSIGVKDGMTSILQDEQTASLIEKLLKKIIEPIAEIAANLKGSTAANSKRLENIEKLLERIYRVQAATDIRLQVYATFVGDVSWNKKSPTAVR